MVDMYGFVGLGLIGGSIAKAIKKQNKNSHILIYEHHKNNIKSKLQAGKEDGIIDKITHSLEEFSSCTIIFLCAPVLSNIKYLEQLKAIISPNCIITDVGSVKNNICEAAAALQLQTNFIGGHPMAGSEKIGYENAKDYLLENAFYILTPFKETPASSIDKLKNLVSLINAIPIILDAKEHDNIVAAISHVPHVIASSLVSMVKSKDTKDHKMRTLAAGGFKDITRIASSSPVMWQNICLTNKESIQTFLSYYKESIDNFLELLRSENEDGLLNFFEDAKECRDSIPASSNGILEKTYELYLDIIDETGAIASIAVLLGNNNISIKNIGIIHNREFQEGVLRIEFYEKSSMEQAICLFKENQYTIYER